MGTTLDEMKGGSTSRVWVVAIEGYPFLLTSGSPAAALTAWNGTDWTQALPGLFVELDNEQTFDPWQPLQGGGTCTLKVVPASNSLTDDQFAIDLNKTISTPETQITATVDRNDMVIPVNNTTGFDAAGEAYLGNECFFYSSKSSTAFTVFSAGATRRSRRERPAAHGWAEPHRAGFIDATTPVHPLVTKYRRTWVGAWVAVYAHRIVNGVLDTRDQAQLVFAGQIADHVDDAATGAAVVHLTNVLNVIRDTTLLRDQFQANLEDGIYVDAGGQFDWHDVGDYIDSAGHFPITPKDANSLVVVASGASGPNQMNAGFYDALDLVHVLNTWLTAEVAAGRLNARFYSFDIISVTGNQGTSSRLRLQTNLLKADFSITDPVSYVPWWYRIHMPFLVAAFLGVEDLPSVNAFGVSYDSGIVTALSDQPANTQQVFDFNVYRIIFGSADSTSIHLPARIGSSSGVLFDQYNWLPSNYAPLASPYAGSGWTWGFFLVNGKNLVLAALSGTDIKLTIQLSQNEDDSLHYGDDGTITLTQIAGLSFPSWIGLLQQVFRGSGTLNYNDDAADVLPFGLGIGLPASLAPDPAFLASIVGQDGASLASILWIRQPTKLSSSSPSTSCFAACTSCGATEG